MAFTEKFSIHPLAPLNFGLTCQVFSSGDPHVRAYVNGEFSQVLQANGELVLAKIKSKGNAEQPELSIQLTSNKPIDAKTKQATLKALNCIFSLNFPLKTFYKEAKKDPVMQKISQALYGFKFPTTPTAFEGLVDAIVEQQISIKVARTIEERLAKKLGDRLEINGEAYYAFPTPQNIRDACISDIRECGLSQRKAEYIYNAAEQIVDEKLNLEGMKNEISPEQIIAELDQLKGVGVWTAELTLLRGMQRFDVLPADDFGIRRVISTYYCGGRAIKAAEARQIAEAWGKWMGLAAFYLIIAEVKGITV
jgi:DNA-3-methyladenine glycosylase II